MEALWPLGVPNVRSSIPEVAMRPVGRGVSVAMVRAGIDFMLGIEGFVVLWVRSRVVVGESLWRGLKRLNMEMRGRS